ncbi:bifunctional tetrahydrofolate synthase/dihydrofolate synthase [Methylotenera versatilis]|nr:bifunctional tetrahydrofolate synthase/dihydrofolate synthase [Methylotenera versatilis]
MHNSKSTKNLAEWLSYIESLHPKSIAMGLDRVRQMIDRLELHPKFTIITVAGTNGKGSTCAMLEQIYTNAGYQVGCYTSPHLLRYNERVRINKQEVSDDALCAAFEAVDAGRIGANGEVISLTYFEVGTLAAMWHFMQTGVDVAILEIGLGGRLDAVNAFEPNCSIVTSIDLDHQEFLGNTRESIGFEKAGVYRTSVPAICGDANPPLSLVTFAHEVKANFKRVHHDFDFSLDGVDSWQYSAGEVTYRLPIPALKGAYQLNNAACAVSAVDSLQSRLPVTSSHIESAMRQVSLAGRFQTASTSPHVILDVAHNPHAARALAVNLNASRTPQGQTVAVFAMLADKDIQGVVQAVKDEIDLWYIAGIDNVRGASAEELAAIVSEIDPHAKFKTFQNADIAYQQACIDVGENDKILVFGSFYTVASVMQSF